MNALFPMEELRRCDLRFDRRDWLTIYREAEAAAELAAEAVRLASEAYKASRNPETVDAYRRADNAYDQARLRFQLKSCEIVRAVRAVAGLPRAFVLAEAMKGRML